VIRYGAFLTALVTFVIIAAVLYLILAWRRETDAAEGVDARLPALRVVDSARGVGVPLLHARRRARRSGRATSRAR
jgi:hypothetical protein